MRIEMHNEDELVGVIDELCYQLKTVDWVTPIKAQFAHTLMKFVVDNKLHISDGHMFASFPGRMKQLEIRANEIGKHLAKHLPSQDISPTSALAAWETWCLLEKLNAEESEYVWDVLQAHIVRPKG